MKRISLLLLYISLSPVQALAEPSVLNHLYSTYQDKGVKTIIAAEGKKLWEQDFSVGNSPQTRSCTSCHSRDLTAMGKHLKTGKPIKPMSPGINAERLSDARKIEKWLKRNCKWTLGRECTAQEKANLLAYIDSTR